MVPCVFRSTQDIRMDPETIATPPGELLPTSNDPWLSDPEYTGNQFGELKK